MPADELMRHARRIAAAEGSVLDIDRCDTPAAALTRARETTSSDGLICATGSFFLAAEMKELLTRERSRE
jgi:folylpolyglutamate synthase/dihydropteroate synthase